MPLIEPPAVVCRSYCIKVAKISMQLNCKNATRWLFRPTGIATVLTLIGRYWRRLFLAPPAASSVSRPAGTADHLPVVPAPAGFTPRNGELVHAHGPVQGADAERRLDLGTGTLLVTSRGVVYFTGAKRWRFSWRGVDRIGVENGRTLELETRSRRHFSFRLSSTEEAEAMITAAHTAWDNRSHKDDG